MSYIWNTISEALSFFMSMMVLYVMAFTIPEHLNSIKTELKINNTLIEHLIRVERKK